MATVTEAAFGVVALEEIDPGTEQDGRVQRNIRRHFGIRGFGVRANRAVGDGHVIGEHDEVGLGASGQEELYLVVSGAATFNVDGERVEAIRHLQQALEADDRIRENLRTDEGLDSIREDPRFSALAA
jgi:hypothetical protein